MFKFVLQRLIQSIPSMLGVTIIGFFLVHIVPGGPAQAMLGPKATPLRIAQINREFGLNKPLPVQYIHWLAQLLQGNLGVSYYYNESVWSLIMTNMPRTLSIVGIGIVIAHVVSILLGSVQAYFHDTKFDYVMTALTYFFTPCRIFGWGLLSFWCLAST